MRIGCFIPAKGDAEGIHEGENTKGKQIGAAEAKLSCRTGQETGETQDINMENIEKERGLAEYHQRIPGTRWSGQCTLISKEGVQTQGHEA